MPGLGNKDIAKDARRLRPLIAAGGNIAAAPSTDHGALNGLGDDDHAQYVHASSDRSITAQHTFEPGSVQAPFLLGTNAQDQTVTGFDADSVDGFDLDQGVQTTDSPTFVVLTVNYINLANELIHTGDTDTKWIFGDDQVTIRAGSVDMIDIVESTTDYVNFPAGLVFVNETANSKMTKGITINQGSNTDETLALKSSLTHGLTSETETDTYGFFTRWGVSDGLHLAGLTGGSIGLLLEGYALPNTNPPASAGGPIEIRAWANNGGTSGEVLASNEGVLVVNNGTSNMLAIYGNGDHYIQGSLYDLSDIDTGLVFGSNDTFSLQAGGVTMIDIVEGATDYVNFPAGLVFVNETANTKMTKGVTINQGANDDEILAFKSSDIAHGMTSITETDTYGKFEKGSGAVGALVASGFGESQAGMSLIGYAATTDATTGTGALAPMLITGRTKSGTSYTSLSAGQNVVVFRNGTNAIAILKGNGDLKLDGTSEGDAFDNYDDAALARAMQISLADPARIIRSKFDELVRYNQGDLERAGLITVDEKGHTFISIQQAIKLLLGAVWQQQTKILELEARL